MNLLPRNVVSLLLERSLMIDEELRKNCPSCRGRGKGNGDGEGKLRVGVYL